MDGDTSIRSSDYYNRLSTTVTESYKTLPLLVGSTLKLFDHLGDPSAPKTSQQVADSANLKERYVREWLGNMVVNEFVECDETGKLFWLTTDAKNVLSRTDTVLMLKMLGPIPILAATFDKLCSCFKPDGPRGIPYSEYTRIHENITAISNVKHGAILLPKMIPSIPNMERDLENGLTCLDVGCGHGVPSFLMAQRFPKSQFYGLDFCENAIEEAKKKIEKTGGNLHYVAMDAGKMPEEWTGKFDYITVFDAVHDQARPDLCLKEIHRVLKPDGRFSMVETSGTSNPFQDRGRMASPSLYFYSLFHCMPVSLYFPDGMGLGAAWGSRLAISMLKDTGFDNIQLLDMPWDTFNLAIHYFCTKDTLNDVQ